MSNRFPQLEWINVDGRQVPVPKVQHYKKGSTTETELTGHDNPFPTTDKAVLDELAQVKAELEAIKNGTLNVNQAGLSDKIDELLTKQNEILERLNEPVDTRLTGSIREYGSLIERGIYTSTVDKFIIVPSDAIGAIIQLSTYAVTGNVMNGGARLRVRNYATNGEGSVNVRDQFSDMTTEYINVPNRSATVIIYPLPSIADNPYDLAAPPPPPCTILYWVITLEYMLVSLEHLTMERA